MKILNKKINLDISIALLAFAFYFIWSITLPYNTGPDEAMRYQIPQYILQYGKLPHGGDPIIRNNGWGISYAFTPILSYIISSFFMRIVRIFTDTEFALLTAARFASVLFSTGTVFMCVKIGKKLISKPYQYLLAILVGFLPEFAFISAYVNNDALAIFSTSLIIYFWIIGLESNWDLKSCIGLAIGISICGLSYYNAYGYILCSILLFIISFIWMNKNKHKKIFLILVRKGLLISGIVIALIGWWFIRSYIIYDGDILGLKTSNEYAELYAFDYLKPSNRQTIIKQGKTIFYMLFKLGWLKSSFYSFIGIFDYLTFGLRGWMFFIYKSIIAIGLIGCLLNLGNHFMKNRFKSQDLSYLGMVISSAITIFISIFYSYTSDYQSQGRYCMPIIIPLMLFIVIGVKYLLKKCNPKTERVIISCLLINYVLISFIAYTIVIVPYYYH